MKQGVRLRLLADIEPPQHWGGDNDISGRPGPEYLLRYGAAKNLRRGRAG